MKQHLQALILLVGSKQAVAKELGYTERHINNYLNGKTEIPKAVEMAIKQLLANKAA